jgi:hypothetical protein
LAQDLAKVAARVAVFFERFGHESLSPFGPLLALVGAVDLVRPHKAVERAVGGGASRRVYLPGGPLLVAQFTTYVVFMNGLANLSFSPLHMNITARMWLQVPPPCEDEAAGIHPLRGLGCRHPPLARMRLQVSTPSQNEAAGIPPLARMRLQVSTPCEDEAAGIYPSSSL